MRSLTATLAVAFISTASIAQADHRIIAAADRYHDSVHYLTDFVTDGHNHAPSYLVRYIARLDQVASDFQVSLVHDVHCSRTQALFADMRSLHYRIHQLIGHSCRALRELSPIWNDADYTFHQLEREFAHRHHDHHESVVTRRVISTTPSRSSGFRYDVDINSGRNPASRSNYQSPQYQLDRQREDRRQIEANYRSSDMFSRMLISLFN